MKSHVDGTGGRRAWLGGMSGAVFLVLANLGWSANAIRADDRVFKDSWEHYLSLRAAAARDTTQRPAALPDWSGVWVREPEHSGFDSRLPREAADRLPLVAGDLTPKYRVAYERKVAEVAKGNEWDRLSDCLPAGFPRFLADPFLREFIVTPWQTWMTLEQISETRRIYTDGRAHVPDDEAVPLWEGDSIGFWDHGVLTVHTNHVKAGEYARGDADFSFQLSSVEQLSSVGPGMIEDRITIYDPPSRLKPWQVVFRYKRVANPAIRVNYFSCEENNNVFRGANGSTQYRLPGATGYRDPDTFGIPEVAQDTLP